MHNTYTREEVEHALVTVLHDAKFAAAPQMSAFLKFVVLQTLDGNADRIKAYTVAVDALGKPPTFDPQNDPSVRVLAKRLRDTLTAYYQRTTGHTLVLLLKSGSYIPSFVSVEFAEATRQQSNVTSIAPVAKKEVELVDTTPIRLENTANFRDRAKVESKGMETNFMLGNKLAKP